MITLGGSELPPLTRREEAAAWLLLTTVSTQLVAPRLAWQMFLNICWMGNYLMQHSFPLELMGSFPTSCTIAVGIFMVVFRWIWRRQAPEKCWEIWPKGKQVSILYNRYMISNHWLFSEKIKCIMLLNIYKLYEKSTSRSWSLKTK